MAYIVTAWAEGYLSACTFFLFFYDLGKFDCTQHVDWGILLHTISYNFSDT